MRRLVLLLHLSARSRFVTLSLLFPSSYSAVPEILGEPCSLFPFGVAIVRPLSSSHGSLVALLRGRACRSHSH